MALITDGRFSGGSHGFVIGHITPKRSKAAPSRLIEDGDQITVDAEKREIFVHLSDDELDERRIGSGSRPEPYADRGALAKYARLVSSATFGAVTDRD